MRWALLACGLLISGPAIAADNYAATEGSGKTFRCVDVAGICVPAFTFADQGNVLAGAFANYGTSPGAVKVPGVNAFVTNTNANGTATAANSSPVVQASDSVDVCYRNPKVNQTVSFQTTTLTQIIAASGSNKIYICSLALVASAATVFSISGGTSTNCASNQLGILGVAGSATHGLSLAANGGLTLGNGSGTVAVTAASSEICLVQTGAGDISGNITYVYAP